MKYCPKCDNIFNYEENTVEKTLTYFCYTCNIHEPIEDNCIITKTLKKENKPQYINFNDIANDKTLPSRNTETCNKCHKNDMVFIRNEDLSVIYICKTPNCKNIIQHSKI